MLFTVTPSQWDSLCFFFMAVAYKLPWTATSSLLGQLSRVHGPSVLLAMNLAYLLPSLPVLLAQSLWGTALERRIGIVGATTGRLVAGLGGLSALCLLLPAASATRVGLLSVTAAVGVFYALAFGTSYQLAARFPPGATIALTTGFVSCGVVVLCLELLLKHSADYSHRGLVHLFTGVSLQVLLGLAAALRLMRRHGRRLAAGSGGGARSEHPKGRVVVSMPLALEAVGHDAGGQAAADAVLPAAGAGVRHRAEAGGGSGGGTQPQAQPRGWRHPDHASPSGQVVPSTRGTPSPLSWDEQAAGLEAWPLEGAAARLPVKLRDAARDTGHRRSWWGRRTALARSLASQAGSLATLLRAMWPAALVIATSVGTSMLVFPLFTFVRSTGMMGAALPQVLFYVRLGGDIAGRLVPSRWHARGVRGLAGWATLKAALTPLLATAMLRPPLLRALGGDAVLMALVGVFWALSGYCNAGAYLLAPRLAPADKARAGGLMTCCFQAACFCGLALAALVQAAVTTESEV